MRIDMTKKEMEIIRGHKNYQRYLIILMALSVLVAAVVTISLIKPAVTMSYICGHEEHVHSEGCYSLTCEENVSIDEETGEETEHVHSIEDGCYDTSIPLCGMDEHVHTAECEGVTEKEEAPDVLTAEEMAELDEENGPEYGTDGTYDSNAADEADAGSDGSNDENYGDPEDMTGEPAEDMTGEEVGVITDVPDGYDSETTETATTLPEDEEIMLVEGATMTAVTSAPIAILHDGMQTMTMTNVAGDLTVEVNYRQVGLHLEYVIEVINNSDVPMFDGGSSIYDSSSYGTLSSYNPGDMYLTIQAPADYVTYGPCDRNMECNVYLNNSGKEETVTSNFGPATTGLFRFVSDDVYKNGTKVRTVQRPTFVIPMPPLGAHEKYTIFNDAKLDLRKVIPWQGNEASAGHNGNVDAGPNVVLHYSTESSTEEIGVYCDEGHNGKWSAETGLSIDANTNIVFPDGKPENGVINWTVTLNNRFGGNINTMIFKDTSMRYVSGNTNYPENVRTVTIRNDSNREWTYVRNWSNSKTTGQLGTMDWGLGDFTFDPRGFDANSSRYTFTYSVPSSVFAGDNKSYCEIRTKDSKSGDVRAPANYEPEYKVEPYIRGYVQEENVTLNSASKTGRATFVYDFAFLHDGSGNNTAARSKFVCVPQSVDSSGNPHNVFYYDGNTPDVDNVQIYLYNEWAMDGVDIRTLNLKKGYAGAPGLDNYDYYVENYGGKVLVHFIKDPLRAGNRAGNTARIRIVIPSDIKAQSLINGASEATFSAEGVFTHEDAGSSDTNMDKTGHVWPYFTVMRDFIVYDSLDTGKNKKAETSHRSNELTTEGSDKYLCWNIEGHVQPFKSANVSAIFDLRIESPDPNPDHVDADGNPLYVEVNLSFSNALDIQVSNDLDSTSWSDATEAQKAAFQLIGKTLTVNVSDASLSSVQRFNVKIKAGNVPDDTKEYVLIATDNLHEENRQTQYISGDNIRKYTDFSEDKKFKIAKMKEETDDAGRNVWRECEKRGDEWYVKNKGGIFEQIDADKIEPEKSVNSRLIPYTLDVNFNRVQLNPKPNGKITVTDCMNYDEGGVGTNFSLEYLYETIEVLVVNSDGTTTPADKSTYQLNLENHCYTNQFLGDQNQGNYDMLKMSIVLNDKTYYRIKYTVHMVPAVSNTAWSDGADIGGKDIINVAKIINSEGVLVGSDTKKVQPKCCAGFDDKNFGVSFSAIWVKAIESKKGGTPVGNCKFMLLKYDYDNGWMYLKDRPKHNQVWNRTDTLDDTDLWEPYTEIPQLIEDGIDPYEHYKGRGFFEFETIQSDSPECGYVHLPKIQTRKTIHHEHYNEAKTIFYRAVEIKPKDGYYVNANKVYSFAAIESETPDKLPPMIYIDNLTNVKLADPTGNRDYGGQNAIIYVDNTSIPKADVVWEKEWQGVSDPEPVDFSVYSSRKLYSTQGSKRVSFLLINGNNDGTPQYYRESGILVPYGNKVKFETAALDVSGAGDNLCYEFTVNGQTIPSDIETNNYSPWYSIRDCLYSNYFHDGLVVYARLLRGTYKNKGVIEVWCDSVTRDLDITIKLNYDCQWKDRDGQPITWAAAQFKKDTVTVTGNVKPGKIEDKNEITNSNPNYHSFAKGTQVAAKVTMYGPVLSNPSLPRTDDLGNGLTGVELDGENVDATHWRYKIPDRYLMDPYGYNLYYYVFEDGVDYPIDLNTSKYEVVTVNNGGALLEDGTRLIKIINYEICQIDTIPSTGGTGTDIFIDVGAAMIACSATILLIRKRSAKKRRDDSKK